MIERGFAWLHVWREASKKDKHSHPFANTAERISQVTTLAVEREKFPQFLPLKQQSFDKSCTSSLFESKMRFKEFNELFLRLFPAFVVCTVKKSNRKSCKSRKENSLRENRSSLWKWLSEKRSQFVYVCATPPCSWAWHWTSYLSTIICTITHFYKVMKKT